MKTSSERILTTHAGSLARPEDLLDMILAKDTGQAYDQEAFGVRVRGAVADIVRRQEEVGVDILCDGEQGKSSFVGYIGERLTGFEKSDAPFPGFWAGSREVRDFPEFYAWYGRGRPAPAGMPFGFVCTGPVNYIGQEVLRTDIENLKAAVQGVKAEEVFMTAISPTNVEGPRENQYYATDEEYLYAISDAMREEYNAIVDAGFLLQIDDPLLVTYYATHTESSVADSRRWAELRVEALNYALRDISPDKVRFHTCYSIDIGPRIHDMELKDIVDIILKINAGGYSFEAANPRHEHEWQVWQNVDLPEGKVLVPGVIAHSTNLVEHPELVAQRLERFASVVGRENVIAGADCGFSSLARRETDVHPTVVWHKFQAMVEGARIASEHLWG